MYIFISKQFISYINLNLDMIKCDPCCAGALVEFELFKISAFFRFLFDERFTYLQTSCFAPLELANPNLR